MTVTGARKMLVDFADSFMAFAQTILLNAKHKIRSIILRPE
jgi:hypothetical protein